MAGENWSRTFVEQELKVTTVINDHGTAPNTSDLRIGPALEENLRRVK